MTHEFLDTYERTVHVLRGMIGCMNLFGRISASHVAEVNDEVPTIDGTPFVLPSPDGRSLLVAARLLYTKGKVKALSGDTWIDITDDHQPDADEVLTDWLADALASGLDDEPCEDISDEELAATLGFGADVQPAPPVKPVAEKRQRARTYSHEMSAEAEDVMADAAPVYERDGLGGVWVRSRTPADERDKEQLAEYHVTGQRGAYKCNCPAGKRGRGCWHVAAVELMPTWEHAARSMFAAVKRSSSCDDARVAQAVASSWRRLLAAQPKTRRGKVDVLGAMRRFDALGAALVTRLDVQRARSLASSQ